MKKFLKKNNISVKEFIIKTTVITSLFIWILGRKISEFFNIFTGLLIEPFFSFDLNENGEPDLKELMSYKLTIGNVKIPIGRIIMEIIKLLFHLLIIYILIYVILNKTDLISFR